MNKRTGQFFKTATVLLAMVALVGCGQNSATKNSASSSKVTNNQKSPSRQKKASKSSSASQASKSSSTSTKVTAKAQSQTPWNASKDQQLEAFINQWAPTMGQSYHKYDGHTPLKTSVGTTYPETLSHSPVTSDPGSIGWSPKGTGNYDYNVVAIYNYDGTQPPLPNHITYAFAFHRGQPIVLVDQSRDGGPSLHETQNTQVKAAFDKIADSTATTNSQINTTPSTSKLDPNTIGVLIKLMTGDDVTQEKDFLEVDTYNSTYPYVIDVGTGASAIPYRYNATEITYGLHDPDHYTYEGVFIPHTISIQSLIDQYYHTPEQIAKVKQAVADLQHHV